jgi:hypothetical protein
MAGSSSIPWQRLSQTETIGLVHGVFIFRYLHNIFDDVVSGNPTGF